MESQAVLLYRLQTIDLDIARRRARLKAIETLLSGDETVAQAAQAYESAERALKPWQNRARDLDLEIKAVVSKAQSADADLYSGRITSPKALQEIQDEIAALKRRQSALEDELLEAMLEVEDHQAQVAQAQDRLASAHETFAGSQADLLAEKQRLQAEIAQDEQKRAAAAAGVEPTSLAAYEKLRPRMRGQAVSLLQSGGCSMCGVEQTSMIVQQVRSGKLVYCGTCGRILAEHG